MKRFINFSLILIMTIIAFAGATTAAATAGTSGIAAMHARGAPATAHTETVPAVVEGRMFISFLSTNDAISATSAGVNSRFISSYQSVPARGAPIAQTFDVNKIRATRAATMTAAGEYGTIDKAIYWVNTPRPEFRPPV